MHFWDGSWQMGGFGMMFLWVVVIIGAGVVVWLVSSSGRGAPRGGEDSPETILKRRYAKGEIDRDEYVRRLEELRR
ncbi:MAG: SHOCT domain-containing protein [Gemmatimonadota bacterium]